MAEEGFAEELAGKKKMTGTLAEIVKEMAKDWKEWDWRHLLLMHNWMRMGHLHLLLWRLP